jgi:hypothetical protein
MGVRKYLRSRRGQIMATRHTATDDADLKRARAAAKECERAADQIAAFAERMPNVLTPAESAEFDELIAREATAISRRVDAFGRLGLGVSSLEATGAGEETAPA